MTDNYGTSKVSRNNMKHLHVQNSSETISSTRQMPLVTGFSLDKPEKIQEIHSDIKTFWKQ